MQSFNNVIPKEAFLSVGGYQRQSTQQLGGGANEIKGMKKSVILTGSNTKKATNITFFGSAFQPSPTASSKPLVNPPPKSLLQSYAAIVP